MQAFDIENYINSLPEDIEIINVSCKNLTYLPSLKRFHKLKKLLCFNNKLTSLPELNVSLQELHCTRNNLTSLPELNNELQVLYCSYNQLTSLPKLNNQLKRLYCHTNQLTGLPKLNNELCELQCCCNELTSLPELNYLLQYLDCSNNQLTCLPELNNNLQYLYCNNNQLTSLPEINNKLVNFDCRDNFIPHGIRFDGAILDQEERDRINKAFQRLYRFKLMFWSLKYKAQFRHWLWVKVRLPKIEKTYHPSKLNELLNADMSEEELDNLIIAW